MQQPAPVLHALTEAAVHCTGATEGWLLVRDDANLRVVASMGDEPGSLVGTTVPASSGSAGFVVGSGQPLAIAPRAGDDAFESEVAGLRGHRPTAILCVPCDAGQAVLGALEVIDKRTGGMFSFDDIELASVLGGIAGVVLEHEGATDLALPDPGELADDLRHLATADPARYALVASVVNALLGSA